MSLSNISGPARAMSKLKLKHPQGPEYKRPLGFMQNSAVRKEIASLDAKKDCQRIVYLLTAYEFPVEIETGLKIVYYASGATKALADILGRSDFSKNPVKRYEDSRFIIWKFMESGWDIDEGHRAIMHMNNIHSHYKIPNNQFSMSICSFLMAPLAWIEKFGWRKMTDHERTAWFNYWMKVGELMNIEALPKDEDEAMKWLDEYIGGSNEPSEFSPDIAESIIYAYQKIAKWYTRPFVRLYLRTFSRPAINVAYQLKEVPLPGKIVVALAVKLGGIKRRFFSRHMYPYYIDLEQDFRTYPEGTPAVEEAGPTYIVENIKRKAAKQAAAG